MSRWQHLKHALGIHDWHKIEDRYENIAVTGHGPYSPQKMQKEKFVKKVCCHCGKEEIRRWADRL